MNQTSHSALWWPRMIVLTFVFLAAGNALILYLALSTRTSTVTDTPYEDALLYEAKIREQNAAKHDGVTFESRFTGSEVHLFFAGLDTTRTWSVKLELMRADDQTQDRSVSTTGNGSEFTFETGRLRPGLWLMTVSMSGGDKRYRFESREFVQERHSADDET